MERKVAYWEKMKQEEPPTTNENSRENSDELSNKNELKKVTPSLPLSSN